MFHSQAAHMTPAANPPPFRDAAMPSLPLAINVNVLFFFNLHCRKHNRWQMEVVEKKSLQ
jgi:hypothetical protein